MPLPVSFASFRIFIPGGVLSGETVDQNVRPAVIIEIIGEDEKSFRIGVVDAKPPFEARDGLFGGITFFQLESRVGRRELMSFLEIGPFVPEGAGDNVYFSIVIEVGEVRAFSPEFVGELIFLNV